MADTALTLITDALVDLGVLSDDETPSASQAVGGLRKLNNMIDAWNIENLMVYGAMPYVLPLVAGQNAYTIGPSGNLNIPRPATVESVYLRDNTQPVSNQLDLPLYMYNDMEWQEVGFKGQTATYPNNGVWINQSFPLLVANFDPIPSTSQYSAVFWVSGLISTLGINDVVTLAPGYKRALTSNLAIELAPSYGVEVSSATVKIAQDSIEKLKIKNYQLNEMELPYSLQGWGNFDIRTGWRT